MAPTTTTAAAAAAAAEQQQHTTRKVLGLAAHDASGHLTPIRISRRNTGDDDVAIKVLYCGICHSDLHTIKNEWRNAVYPVVAGHEIAGVVTEVGKNVERFKAGDSVGVGCMVNTCRSCESCRDGCENYCSRVVFTYNSVDRDGTRTHGGYSGMVVVGERFVVRLPAALPPDRGAPLLCAGVTVYAPMRQHGLCEPGRHVGVVGLGGLGHLAVKFAKAFGMKVTVVSTSPAKRQEALEGLGADAFVVSTNASEMKSVMGTMHGIINTACASTSMNPYLALLKPKGKMILVGLPEKPLQIPPFALVAGGKTLAGSCMGSISDTQEMIDFAAEHGVAADIELIGADEVNTAMERLARGDVRYRFVIDIGNTLRSD
ncbi:cinnamyl alcohol dehydrogenase 7-like [Oryza brachyantha]|uniref:cinnamyl-alcohol dehydrogenase n=1 Tax=Oryza brachyantha TaxID=4533 RepID=J3M1B8_ORYBR|nr:cinnamyl alcohol dehydrogenase 7-like [Oryza brachyantha]